MAHIPEAVTKSVAKNEAMARILVHSAFDLSDSLYNFASWLGDDSFVDTMLAHPDKDNVGVRQAALEIKKPIVFGDFNGDNRCMGIGLKAFSDIDN